MKELSVEEKAKAYDKIIRKANKMHHENCEACQMCIEELIPELKKESEDERIRKEIISAVNIYCSEYSRGAKVREGMLAWLEKQGSEPNWCHHKVDLSDCSEEYRKAYYDGWNNCNMQHSQCKSELDDVLKCLINGMKFYYEANKDATWGTDKWSMPVTHIIEVLEKQGEQKPIVPKFKVGDWIRYKTNPNDVERVDCISNDHYILDIKGKCNTVLFTCQDLWELVEQKPTEVRTTGYWHVEDVEQKPADKVNPKFKVGDFIANDYCFGKVVALTNDAYLLDTEQGIPFSCEHNAHLWTIQDAKDGDMLSWDDSKCIAIFKNIYDEDSFNSYGFVGGCTGTFESRMSYHDIEGAHPATKEQRDTLMKAMADAGYIWDSKNKRLLSLKAGLSYTQNPVWSEEDERNLQGIIDEIEANKNHAPDYDVATYDRFLSCLKSLKDRVQPQPKQEWSEEDEQYLEDTLNLLEGHRSKNTYGDVVEWLKELKERYAWKPSSEQMRVLDLAIRCGINRGTTEETTLVSLFNDLKKLREE